MFYKIQNALSERHLDDNGYLFVDKSPILREGILEYYGSELLADGETEVDGVKVDPDKIYKVYISREEIEKGKDSFKLKPITDDHTWLGNEGEDAKEYQVGTIGENLYVEDGYLYAPLEFTGKEIIEKITEHEKEELSCSYYNRFEKSENSEYDFIAKDIKGNHLALVDRGRCGSTVRVLNSIMEKKEMAESKVCNEAILLLDGKKINLDQFFEEEKNEVDEGTEVHEESITENEEVLEQEDDTLELVDNEDIDEKDEEKVENEDVEEKDEDKEEVENKCSNEDEVEIEKEEEKEEETKSESKSMNYDALYAKISNAIRVENEKAEQEKVKAYNSARAVLGDFNPFGLTCKDMYIKALNHLGIALDGKETDAELKAMLKVSNSLRSNVDNNFSYGVSMTEENEFNL